MGARALWEMDLTSSVVEIILSFPQPSTAKATRCSPCVEMKMLH